MGKAGVKLHSKKEKEVKMYPAALQIILVDCLKGLPRAVPRKSFLFFFPERTIKRVFVCLARVNGASHYALETLY